MKMKNVLGCIGFWMACIGMCSLDSEEPGYQIAVGLCVVGYLFLFCWSSKGGKR